MAHPLDPHRGVSSEQDYRTARTELDELLGPGAYTADAHRVDELLEFIEAYEASVRCVPDWSGEPYANAA